MDSIMNALTDADIQFQEDWLDATHGTDHMPWRDYLGYWAEAKDQFLTTLFKGEPIRKFPFSIEKTTEDIERSIDNNSELGNELDNLTNALVEIIKSIVCKRYNLSPRDAERLGSSIIYPGWEMINLGYEDALDRFLTREEFDRDWGWLSSLSTMFACIYRMPTTSWAKNACWFDGTMSLPNAEKPFRVMKGQKPIKVFTSFVKYLAPYADEEVCGKALATIERVRILVSQELNTKNLSGQLCLSIHPMDYMTMSDNNCDWCSCMRWDDDGGGYHAGTLEMMTSPSVVVAYLESNHPWEPLEDGRTWSNKKWRELFIVDKNFISGIKGYPYCSKTLENVVLNKLMDMMDEAGIKFNREIYHNQESDGIVYIPNSEKGFQFRTELMYNDTDYTNLSYCFNENPDLIGSAGAYYYYGLGAYCTKCGSLRTASDHSGREGEFLCNKCSDRQTCSCCGELRDIEGGYWINDDWICEDCYEEHYVQSDVTGKEGLDYDLGLVWFRVNMVSKDGRDDWFEFSLEREIFDTIPDECVESTSRWSENRYTLIRPLPKEIDSRIMRYINKQLNHPWYADNSYVIYYPTEEDASNF